MGASELVAPDPLCKCFYLLELHLMLGCCGSMNRLRTFRQEVGHGHSEPSFNLVLLHGKSDSLVNLHRISSGQFSGRVVRY